jgi:hypothetical protein
MDLLRHSPEDDGTNPMPDEFRKWSKDELIAEVEELNRQVAYWVGVATERRGAVEENERLRGGLRAALDYLELVPDDSVDYEAALIRVRDALGGQ